MPSGNSTRESKFRLPGASLSGPSFGLCLLTTQSSCATHTPLENQALRIHYVVGSMTSRSIILAPATAFSAS